MNTSDILAVVGTALSVVGIPLAVALARRGRKRPFIRYLLDFDVIASSEHGDFSSGFLRTLSGDPVINIARTSVAVWNHQGDTIRGTDIVPDDRLRVQLPVGDRALQARIVSRSRRQNKLSVVIEPTDGSAVYIDFDFLDANDGGIIEIIHQGSTAPVLLGTIRGADVGAKREADLRPELIQASTNSWIKRFKLLPLRRRLAPTILVVLYAIYASGILLYQLFKTPELIDATEYSLESLSGQRDFAREIDINGLPSMMGMWTPPIGALFLALALCWMFRDKIKVSFPRCLVSEFEQIHSEGESQNAEGTSPQPVSPDSTTSSSSAR